MALGSRDPVHGLLALSLLVHGCTSQRESLVEVFLPQGLQSHCLPERAYLQWPSFPSLRSTSVWFHHLSVAP